MARHLLASLNVVVFCLSPAVCYAGTLSLSDYLAEVQRENPNLEAARHRAEAFEHRIGPSSTLDDPFIAGGVDQIPFGGGSGSVYRFQLSQAIPFPGKLGAKGDAAEKRAQAAKADAETTRRFVTVIATQTYFRTYFNHKAIELNERNRRTLQETIESTKARYKTGADSHHEWLLAKVEFGVLEVEKLRLGREKKALHAFLNEMRNKPADTAIENPEPHFSTEKEFGIESENIKQQFAKQPEFRASQNTAEAAEADRHFAKLSYLPDFVIQGMAMKPTSHTSMDTMNGQASNWGILAGINLPIFFWRKQSEQVRAASAEYDAAMSEKRSLENRLNTEIVDAKEQFKSAHDIVALYKKEVIPITAIAAKNARSGYAIRKLPLTQLLEILRVERIQNLELIAAEIDVELAKTRLENLLSSAPTMRLAPPRPTMFGAGVMSGQSGAQSGAMSEGMSSGTSGTVNLGSGLSGPTRKESKPSSQGSGSSGMGNM